MRYMLDTNAVSHLIKAHPVLIQRVTAAPMAALCISAITEGELLFGLAKRPAARQLHAAVIEFLKRVDVLPWDSSTAEHYGTLRASMEAQGKPLAPLDMLIGAHAASVGAVLVTNDRAFQSIGDLKVEDWTVNR
jgi:tRNA(fMet)-specific endonuclease VapC